MAPQDYVSRPKNKKTNPYKKKPAQADTVTSIKVKLIGLFTLVAIIGFSFFLWSIKQQPSDVKIANPETLSAPQAHKATTLPEPPDEKWQYIDKLKEGNDIEVGEYKVEDKGPYKMQCGSFKTRDQAEVMKAKMAFAGLVAQISQSEGANGTWYKVFLGPYAKKRNAEKDKHQLKNNGVLTCQIWLWR